MAEEYIPEKEQDKTPEKLSKVEIGNLPNNNSE